MIQSGIYLIQNKANGKVYVGSAVNIKKRWGNHKHYLRKGKHHSPHLQSSWNKYGEDNFEFIVLTLCDDEFLIKNEQMWLDKTRSYLPERGYNICPTAGSQLGFKHSEEAKRKMGEAKKQMSEETKRKISENNAKRKNAKGYSYEKAKGKYLARISINGKQKSLGRYDTPEEARAAYLAELEIVQQNGLQEAREGVCDLL